MTAETRGDMLLVMERVQQALARGDVEEAVVVVQAHRRQLEAHAEADALPSAPVLRQWLDGYQGLVSHVATLREEARAELRGMQRGRDASRQYAAA